MEGITACKGVEAVAWCAVGSFGAVVWNKVIKRCRCFETFLHPIPWVGPIGLVRHTGWNLGRRSRPPQHDRSSRRSPDSLVGWEGEHPSPNSTPLAPSALRFSHHRRSLVGAFCASSYLEPQFWPNHGMAPPMDSTYLLS